MIEIFYRNGFTLLEMLVTISIILILLSLFIPSQKAMLTKSKTDVMRMQLLRAINLAHIEAITKNELVTICQSSDQKTCFGHWSDGYIVIVNRKVIYAFLNPENQGQLYWRAFPNNQAQLDYLPSGTLRAENGTFWYCSSEAKNPSWAIVISQSGRAREIVPEEQGEIVKDGDRIIYC
jgi:type IV fimbrial biogenesis protein FimT